MDALRNNEEMVICPYNPAHHIRKYRMEVHLTKCRKSLQKTDAVLVECDFNSCHRIPEPELQYHHDTCPDRKRIEMQMIMEATPLPSHFVPMPAVQVPVDESWDECEVESYNPQKYCEENNILRRLDTESAAKRRDFRISERHRINNLTSGKKTVLGTSNTSMGSSQPPKRVNDNNLPPIPIFKERFEDAPNDVSTAVLHAKLNVAIQTATIQKK